MVTSKSGTNQFHGSVFFAIHRPGLNAYNRHPFSSATGSPISKNRDSARFNQEGGSIGGPILKNKLFAFFSYEASPNSSSSTGFGWYETSAFQKSAPSGSIASQYLNFPGGTVAGTYDAAGNCALAGLIEGTNCKTIAGQGIDIGSPLTNGLGKQDPTATNTNANPGVGSGLDGVADVAYYATTTGAWMPM
jgi:hypothetical protein